jgi:hypothetical protein
VHSALTVVEMQFSEGYQRKLPALPGITHYVTANSTKRPAQLTFRACSVRRRCVEGQKVGLVEAPSEMGQKLHNQNAKKNALIFMAPSCGIRELILRKSSNASPTIYCERTLHSNFLPVTHALFMPWWRTKRRTQRVHHQRFVICFAVELIFALCVLQ